MGVPVISLCGQAFVSRFGFVLLKALKLEQLVAQSPQDYVRIATDLAADLPRLTALRASLRTRFNASPLRNELAFTQHIELAYRSMWHTWCLAHSHQPDPSTDWLNQGLAYQSRQQFDDAISC